MQQVTTIDYAYINTEGQLLGGSYNADFEVTGDIEFNEQVVIDFGKVKKAIKQIIDGKFHGFDHKLWIIDGYSNIDTYDSNLNIEDLVCINLTNEFANTINIFYNPKNTKNGIIM